jgi:hypothetical protein
MARHQEDKKGLGVGAIVAGAIFTLFALVSAFLIFHPGGELAAPNAQFARERAGVPVAPKIQSPN